MCRSMTIFSPTATPLTSGAPWAAYEFVFLYIICGFLGVYGLRPCLQNKSSPVMPSFAHSISIGWGVRRLRVMILDDAGPLGELQHLKSGEAIRFRFVATTSRTCVPMPSSLRPS